MQPNIMRERFFLFLFLVLGAPVAVIPSNDSLLLKHIRYLASEELKGRGNNRPEIDEAARYIAAHFREDGLTPAGSKAYFQEFEVITGRRLGADNGVALKTESERLTLEVGTDYFPISFGADTVTEGSLVFAGFGITAPDLNYDDYKDIDVRGKIVLAFEHEPQENSPTSPFHGQQLTPYATVMHKVMNAKHLGAAAVILLPDRYNHNLQELTLDRDPSIDNMGIHVIRVTQDCAERLLNLGGHSSAEINRSLHVHLVPYSFEFKGVTARISLDVVKERRHIKNVLGLVPGQTDEIIILGAHYDHLGLGNKSSLAPKRIGEIHNGADDNASGTAGLLQLAHDFAKTSPRRGLLFIAFVGEELGLLGSQYYAENPTFPLEKTIAMLNMDMIGRSIGNLIIGGVGTASEFKKILMDVEEGSSLQFKYAQTPRGSSDHLSFSLKKIPVLFFFSGLHSDYHKPSDDWEKIDLFRTRQVVEVVRGVIENLDRWEKPLRFVDLQGGAHGAEGSPGRGYGPLFGSLPDMAWESDGVRFAGVREGTPAARAGLKSGDILVRFDGKEINNLYDFTYALRLKQPGDEVEVFVLRENRVVRVKVRLEPRE